MSEHALVRARRRAEAFHVLWVIDYVVEPRDGHALPPTFVVTLGHPSQEGVGADMVARFASTLEAAQAEAAKAHDEFVRHFDPRPSLMFHYTAEALEAA